LILRRNWRNIFILIVFAVDALAVMASGFGAYHVRAFMPNVLLFPTDVFLRLTVYFAAVLLFLGFVLGLYRSSFHSNITQQYFLAGKAYVYGALISFSAFYLLHTLEFPRKFTLLFFLFVPVFFVFGRILMWRFNLFMQTKGYGLHRVLLVGYENGGVKVFERFSGFPELGYDVRGVVTKLKTKSKLKPRIAGSYVPHFFLSEVEDIAKRERIDRIFVPHATSLTNGYSSVLDISRRNHIKVKVLSPEADQLLSRAHVHDIAGITLFAPPRYNVEFVRRVFKRGFDLVASTIILIILSPVLVLTGAAIFVESGLPVFFKQKRAAVRYGKTFNFFKFRSMIKNADEKKESLFELNESDGALFKMKNDPRLTKVGRFIRKFSIDELPQLFNVFLGDMSLVGPRPLPISDFDKVNESDEYWDSIGDRAKVKPGMTGLWQISGRSNIGFREMVLLDLYYVENQSLLFDLEIMFATVPVVLFGKGAY
jgi:exopolysaccharide biosynthesis polyprenyl glycosylphosphotransferase